MKISYAVYSTSGIYRPMNEDNVYINGVCKEQSLANFVHKGESKEDRQLFAIFDGLGGEPGGETASYTAASLMSKYQSDFDQSYQDFIGVANQAICNKPLDSKIAGSTMAALYFNRENATIVNLGDSRVYYLEKNEKLRQLSEDHTEYATLLKYGVLHESDYYTSTTRNHLTRHLGSIDPTATSEPFVLNDMKCKSGDVFMLCSDGYCGTVKPDDIESAMQRKGSLLTSCIKMGEKAAELGSDDNITVMLIKIAKI